MTLSNLKRAVVRKNIRLDEINVFIYILLTIISIKIAAFIGLIVAIKLYLSSMTNSAFLY